MTAFLSPVFGAGAQLFDNTGLVLSGGKIATYIAGSTTAQATWTDSTQAVVNTNPVICNSAGRPANNSGTPTEIWLANGIAYKFVVSDSNNNVIGTFDGIVGVNVTSFTQSQWVTSGFIVTYVSATQFTVPGNQTTIFAVNERVQYTLNSGTFYGYVSVTSYDGVNTTTVTIVADSTGLDNTLSTVNYGLISAVNTSIPQQFQISASSALPPQASGVGKMLVTDGNNPSWAYKTHVARSSNTIWGTTDTNKVFDFTGTFTQTITAGATLGTGANFYYANIGTGVITLDANASETFQVPGGARTTIAIYPGETGWIEWNGTNFDVFGRSNRVLAYTVTSSGADATIDLEQGFTDTEAASIDIEYYGFTGTSDLQGRVKKSAAYITGASYGYEIFGSDGVAILGNTGSATFFYANGQSNSALRNGKISILKPSSAVRHQILLFSSEPLTATAPSFSEWGGLFENTASAMQGFRLYLAAGNIAAGTCNVWINRGA